ncbi:hypothetical protein PsalN5692_02791 [Piscirickettsia salmonis]|uniref:hypothetical protein n=1 Tax=Piscirickettsia salmonis TaxID=1238 RepID=UPI0012B7425D|nr:hypothetical protein [Piscirickettsia salmonis]QGP51310.1 hypothetical protein PsalN5692_02791 [Piscirickettsia salmonis]QGP53476.1 hypothetical protein PsalSR1_00889 [Piscirickettsia salmonis]QGP60605.1 hypothetical protein PsalBI1_03221 [Piscirickettsia salmonis]QGP63044.1 hypothetical protein PsalMR5_00890 [Piscirickettsia salmonis]
MGINCETLLQFRDELLAKLHRYNPKDLQKHTSITEIYYGNTDQAFQRILKAACFKRDLHWYSKRTGRTRTMDYIKEIISANLEKYHELQELLTPFGSCKPDYSNKAMRYFAYHGSLNGFNSHSKSMNQTYENYFSTNSSDNPYSTSSQFSDRHYLRYIEDDLELNGGLDLDHGIQ